ncbi:MAG TPA: PQQ-dependent sugar dehydrogenase [Candidatus Andersenbacteria bacterium]|nr:PQQ-dependent sugar dehydrogenase [Candidatus Andersenbacteria bacterium]
MPRLLAIAGTILVTLVLLAAGTYWQRNKIIPQAFAPTGSSLEVSMTVPARKPEATKVIAQDLAIPWEIAFLPDGALLVTERPGRLLKISANKTVIPITGVQHVGEGGLLGLALHPNFASNQLLYLYLTTKEGSGLRNRVERYRLVGEELRDRTTIIAGIPGAAVHDGGRMAFLPAEAGGPPYHLYITTGDASDEDSAQDTQSLAGKILRLNDDGSIPTDNPFNNAVYSYGHRNPQGLAWDAAGRLWATEHGRSGAASGFDEVNLITPGSNYGWPRIQGDEKAAGLIPPRAHSGAAETWAPAGAAVVGDRLFFTGLRGEALYEARLSGDAISGIVRHFPREFGRLRAVTLGPDGWLYLSTSNTDGRGRVHAGDDKIIKVNPAVL